MTDFATAAQNKDAIAFKADLEARLGEKLSDALEAQKLVVAQNFFGIAGIPLTPKSETK